MKSAKSLLRPAVLAWAVLVLASFGGSFAQADIINFEANLDSFQEVPPNVSPGFGTAELTLNTATNTVSIVSGSYNDLLGNSFAVTLNGLAAVGANGPVILSFTLDNPGTTSGTFSGTALALPDQATADGMVAGNTYINIRDSVFPSGELRGQVIQTPEPSSLILAVLAGIAALACSWRRRRGA
jgi:CHRD domain/PEP-CTERM motif